jgi:hypothetical protein
MKSYTILQSSVALLIGLLTSLPTPALGAPSSDVRLEIDTSASYQVKENYLVRENLELIRDWHFTRDRSYNLVNVHPLLSFAANEHFEGYLGGDIFWENPVEEDQDNEIDGELTAACLTIKGGNIRTDLGIQPVLLGNGFIMADDAPAAVLHMDIGKGYAEFKGALAFDSSPLFGLTLGYRPGYFERVEIFGAQFRDQDDAFAASLPLIYQLFSDLSSEGTLNYYGASARLFIGDTLLSLTGAYQNGEYTITDGTREVITDVEAWFGDISLERNVTEWFSIDIFCFYASGEQVDKPFDGELNALVSIMPYNPRAAIFFDPDFFDNDDADRLTFGGSFAGGVIAPGIHITLISSWGVSAEVSWINFYADEELTDGSRWYGWEADVEVSYTFRDQYQIFVQAARFEHGDFFESCLDETMDPAMQFTVGMSATF